MGKIPVKHAAKDELKVGIIGLGHLHPRAYMPLFTAVPGVRVVAAMDPSPSLRQEFGAEFNIPVYASLDELLAAHRVDIAAIFLPHADCPAAAEVCARAGAHLMVEKPMAADAGGAARIVRAAQRYGVQLTTGYCWRLHPAAIEFKRLVQSNAIGRMIGAEGRCAAGRLQRYIEGHSPWMLQRARSGGGPMFNLGVHWIDLFRWILEENVVEVSGCNVHVNRRYDIEDNSMALLRFSGGAVVTLNISYTVPDAFPHGRDLYLAVRGTLGCLSWAPAYEGERDEIFLCSDHPDYRASPRRHLGFELPPVRGYSGIMGWNYVTDFIAAIRNGSPPAIRGEDGVAALRVVEAIYRSAQSRRWERVRR